MLLVGMFLGLTIWYWKTSWCALPWGKLFPALSIPCFLSSWSPLEPSLLRVSLSVVVIVTIPFLFWQPCW